MQVYPDSVKGSRRLSRVNRYIVVIALLWIAVTVALLLEAHPAHAHANGVHSGETCSAQHRSIGLALFTFATPLQR